jgi:saccharopine dehydrogenase (NAD+, L-lysine-forming)
MQQQRVLLLGGYGNAGLAMARLLATAGDLQITLAGRSIQRAVAAAGRLNAELGKERLSGTLTDAASRDSLLAAFRQADIVVVASSSIEHAQRVAETALEAGIDYFDVQISTRSKHEALEPLRERILEAGRCFITDGGFRPGIPAAMVRYAASRLSGLESAPVASVFQVNWQDRVFSASSAAEFSDELRSFSPLVLKEGLWTAGSMREYTRVDFGAPFGVKYCVPMFMEEFRALPGMIPTLKETGFYSAGFGGVVDYVFIPLAFGLLALSPNGSRNLIARLMEWGLKHTTHPPYGAIVQMDARGQRGSLRMTVAHDDAYVITAAPAVACLLQYFDGSIRKPGMWRQATLVEPARFFADLSALGVRIDIVVGDEPPSE